MKHLLTPIGSPPYFILGNLNCSGNAKGIFLGVSYSVLVNKTPLGALQYEMVAEWATIRLLDLSELHRPWLFHSWSLYNKTCARYCNNDFNSFSWGYKVDSLVQNLLHFQPTNAKLLTHSNQNFAPLMARGIQIFSCCYFIILCWDKKKRLLAMNRERYHYPYSSIGFILWVHYRWILVCRQFELSSVHCIDKVTEWPSENLRPKGRWWLDCHWLLSSNIMAFFSSLVSKLKTLSEQRNPHFRLTSCLAQWSLGMYFATPIIALL
jgi:hypothetical protein